MSVEAASRGVVWTVVFFAAAGVIETASGLAELSRPLAFWPAWEACGRGLLHWLLALGLWRRLALCRSVALVYCMAAVVTYGVVLTLALAHAPVRFPPSVVLASLYQIPSCALLFPYLRSAEASQLLSRPLLGAPRHGRR